MLIDLLKKTRNFRDLSKTNFSRKDMTAVMKYAMETTRFVHGIRNSQSLKYLILLDDKKVKEFSKILKEKLGKENKKEHKFNPDGFIIIINNKEVLEKERSIYCNAGIVAQILTMALQENKIDSCIISVMSDKKFSEKIIKDTKYSAVLVVAFGTSVMDTTVIDISNGESTRYHSTDKENFVPKIICEELYFYDSFDDKKE
ncbi:Oxygen-insensitive NAD(P)H nitroreductase [Lactococcus lactis subsp. lactis]|uniref:hypothetical protein n=1 Tax=Lactococcus lactis TaxID=1358 RepID=UPI00071CC634|nr:hypothetical protein [Lactococcus lactis]KST91469.1 Oxygen-insensitive NAD(P)H nitroreductase [Lactococcus lactis subsp. lactis]